MTDSGAVDDYLVSTLVPQDDALTAASAGADSTDPGIGVAPNQGKLLAVLAGMIGARRVLEFGTLAGYSAIWLARAVEPDGRVVTLELSEQNARVARRNINNAGVGDIVDIMLGPASESADRLIETGQAPFDLVFIDADKPNNPRYLQVALELTHRGSVIVIDNVVRGGAVADADSTDSSVRGVRDVLAMAAADSRLDGTAVQTVGSKGWDGFALFRRVN